jgi:hypothetical protein
VSLAMERDAFQSLLFGASGMARSVMT